MRRLSKSLYVSPKASWSLGTSVKRLRTAKVMATSFYSRNRSKSTPACPALTIQNVKPGTRERKSSVAILLVKPISVIDRKAKDEVANRRVASIHHGTELTD